MKLTKFKSWGKTHNRIILMVSCLVLILCLGGGAIILYFSGNSLPDDGSLELLLDEEMENTGDKIASNADTEDNDQETYATKSDSGYSSPDDTITSSDRNSENTTQPESSDGSSLDGNSSNNSSGNDNNSSSSTLPEDPDSETSPENPDSGDTNNGVIQTDHPYELPFIPVNP